MASSIFASLDGQEERQVCERIASKKLNTAQYEGFVSLMGISKESPHYSPPSGRRWAFQYFIQQALQFSGRVATVPALPATTSVWDNKATLSERQIVSDGQHPLADAEVDTSVAADTVQIETTVTGPSEQVMKAPTSTVSSYRLAVTKFLSLGRRSRNKPLKQEEQMPSIDAPDTTAVAVPPTVITPPPTEAYEPRIVNFSEATGYATPGRRAYLFEEETVEDPFTPQQGTEFSPILTPLQRAIAQARAHGYHLHQRQPLSYKPTTSSSLCIHSPPGLAHMKHKYCLRTHQIAAGDYFRKEAAHRAAVAARNYNIAQGKLISTEERHLHEPTGMIIPDYEISRLRVVYAPRRFPVRLWKTQERGPEDWIEVEDRSCTGGLGMLKCPSPLRVEIIPEESTEERPVSVLELESGDIPEADVVDVAIALEEEEEATEDIKMSPVEAETPVAIVLPEAEPESTPVHMEQAIPEEISEPQPALALEAEKVPRWKRLARSLSQAKETSSDSHPLPRPKPRFPNSGRNRHSSKDHSRSTSPSPRPRRRSIGDHSVPKLTPVQRMRAAARTMTGSASSGDVSKGERVKEKTGSSLLSRKHGSSKKRRAAAAQEELPGCLDPNVAENHRQSLLAKYYNPKAMKRPSLGRQSALAASTSQTDVGEDNLSEASDETLTNDTASVDTAHEPLDEPQSTVADKTAALEQDRPSSPRCNTRKEVSQPTDPRPESWLIV